MGPRVQACLDTLGHARNSATMSQDPSAPSLSTDDSGRLPPFAPGSRFGHYRIVRLLAQGGMAEVHLARRELGSANDVLAIKRLHPHLARSPEFVEMFRFEARIASR